MVYTVHMVYAVDMVYNVDMVYMIDMDYKTHVIVPELQKTCTKSHNDR